ncbi:Translation initiation factor 3 [Desulfurella amilsii]|uniref:Translation initiation factor IF-3 n=1 Tax=Desulfurella amilsii TaxID=1562698 RepID=A0A1X4XWL7_9BACT|nr:translation initiation factor IF-3 [Desulfurella amilsii]OSS41932.1 Translation initiation factor 3 [Desulfurella amilsii]
MAPINEHIKAEKVRLIDQEGKQLGIVSIKEALEKAREAELDLVAIAPAADPVVCKIMDYGKFKYDKQKKEEKSKKKQKIMKVKELKMRLNIAENDYKVKLNNAIEFLKDGDKVKFSIFFKGREIEKKNLFFVLSNRLKIDLQDYAVLEGKELFEGRRLSVSFIPKK